MCFFFFFYYWQIRVVGEEVMTSRGAKENLVARLGFKSSTSVSKSEAEMEKLKQENAHLRRKIDDMTKRHARSPSSDKTKLLEVSKGLSFLSRRRVSWVCFLTVPCLFCHFCMACDVGFRGSFLSRRFGRETINSYLLRSKNWKPWDSSWQPEEERYVCWHITPTIRWIKPHSCLTNHKDLCKSVFVCFKKQRFGHPQMCLSPSPSLYLLWFHYCTVTYVSQTEDGCHQEVLLLGSCYTSSRSCHSWEINSDSFFW